MLLSVAVKIIWQLMVAGCSTGDTRAAQFICFEKTAAAGL